ncbi:MAG TPA: carbohydrate binding family 9 domain-containing protein, partial [Thermoanaerobaculia bacterium]
MTACRVAIGRVAMAMLVAAGAASASDELTRPVIAIPRVSRPPRLDDFLRGGPREAESMVSDFRQYEPGDGIPASHATTAYLSYDADHLHVAFVCEQDHRSLRAHLAKREELESDDGVVVELDTFGDRRHSYVFFSNPFGIQMDAIRTEGQETDESWDAVWTSEGRITAEGYVVLMSIPFRSVRYPNRTRQEWGIALARTIRVNEETSTWPPTTQRIESFVGQFATLKGLEGISRARGLAMLPHIAATQARYLDERDSAFRRDASTEAGVDGKMVIRDSLTLDLTENPDFSQV